MVSSSHVDQLVEMGIERALAEAALAKFGRVTDAAEAILEGRFELPSGSSAAGSSKQASTTPIVIDDDSDDGDDVEMGTAGDDEDDDADDDDHDDAWSVGSMTEHQKDDDPYKDIDMSKDRVETTIDIEQIPKRTYIDGTPVEEVTQSEWMRGCPQGNEQSLLFGLLQQLNEDIRCPSCGSKQTRAGGTYSIMGFWPSLKEFVEHTRATVQRKCTRCSAAYCSACTELAQKQSNGNAKSENQEITQGAAGQDALLHCPELQSVLLGIGLGHVERLFFDDSKSGISDAVKLAMGSVKRKRPGGSALDDIELDDDPDAELYSTLTKRSKPTVTGTGYAGHQQEAKVWASAATQKQQENDQALADSLALLRNFLPTLSRAPNPVPSDYMPHTTTLAHLRRRFLPIASRLLSSDSFIDMSERLVLYDELFLWLQLMSNNETLAPLVAQPIMLKRTSEFKEVKNGSAREKHVRYSGSAGPRELLQSIVRQCQTVMDRMKRHGKRAETAPAENGQTPALEKAAAKEPEASEEEKKKKQGKAKQDDEEADKLLTFCQAIIGTTEKIDTLLRKTKGDAMVDKLLASFSADPKAALKAATDPEALEQAGDTEAEVEAERKRAYESWAKSLLYADVDLSVTRDPNDAIAAAAPQRWRHVYNTDICGTQADNSKRTMMIAKELASLQVSLPALWHGSIFLRVDESRIDVLKACVVGPEGSPYESGLFFFDIFLPASYNSEPPKVKIITTNDGRHRFNPNLYADGKVCLSLLGTWSGPGWVKGRSTLLQVLLSIQSLIMGEEEPCVNEPGWANERGSKNSLAYNKNLRRMTVATAMVKNLQDPPHPWKEVVEGHFRAKAKDVLSLAEKWLAEDDGRPLKGDGASYMRIEAYDAAFSTSNHGSAAAIKDKEFEKKVQTLRGLIEGLQTQKASS